MFSTEWAKATTWARVDETLIGRRWFLTRRWPWLRWEPRIRVSTVFLGLDHQWGDSGPPLLFETMIFGGSHDEYQRRCSTWEEAELQHARAVAVARRGGAMKRIVDLVIFVLAVAAFLLVLRAVRVYLLAQTPTTRTGEWCRVVPNPARIQALAPFAWSFTPEAGNPNHYDSTARPNVSPGEEKALRRAMGGAK